VLILERINEKSVKIFETSWKAEIKLFKISSSFTINYGAPIVCSEKSTKFEITNNTGTHTLIVKIKKSPY
jgi:hypothetical protein